MTLFFEATIAALDSRSVPSLTTVLSSFAACKVAALRKPIFSTRTVQRQYSFVIMPTRN